MKSVTLPCVTSLIRDKEEKMCVGWGGSVPHFIELFLIPLGASIGYLFVCLCVCVYTCMLVIISAGESCSVLCRVALWH